MNALTLRPELGRELGYDPRAGEGVGRITSGQAEVPASLAARPPGLGKAATTPK